MKCSIGIFTVLLMIAIPVLAIDEIPEKKLVSRGGVLYPQVGDATQEHFQTPPNVKDILSPGMVIGILPDDCVSASSGALGDYYLCDHDLRLKPLTHEGKPVYQVIEFR